MVIARNPQLGLGRNWDEMKRNSFPDLFKPLRDLNFDQKREELKFRLFTENKKLHDCLLFSVNVSLLNIFKLFWWKLSIYRINNLVCSPVLLRKTSQTMIRHQDRQTRLFSHGWYGRRKQKIPPLLKKNINHFAVGKPHRLETDERFWGTQMTENT